MAPFTKIMGHDHERKTRLHTRRGLFAPSGVIGALRDRNLTQVEPWMAPGAVRRLDNLLTADMTLLELGSGSSTAWYAARVRSVVSIEPDAEWAARTAATLHAVSNVRIVASTVAEALPLSDHTEVVIIDHNDEEHMTRIDALRISREYADILVLDDSDRAAYREADGLLAGWVAERYVGFRPRPLVPTETTIFIRRT